MTTDVSTNGDPDSLFGYRNYRLFLAARLLMSMAIQMQTVAVGWHVYSVTHSALYLGYIGLVQFLPAGGFILFTGHAADRFDRRKLVVTCYLGEVLCSSLLALTVFFPQWGVLPIFACVFLIGTANAFAAPASQSLMPHLVPDRIFGKAVVAGSTAFQVSCIAGPALGGALYALTGGPQAIYILAACMGVAAASLMFSLSVRTGRLEKRAASLETLFAGVKFVMNQRVVLGAITLDLFAVLLGGAVALLPVYAKDILDVGPTGLGLLRCAPAAGAALIAVYLHRFPLERQIGRNMFACVVIFGLATIAFGLSKHFAFSLIFLVILGAADMISVVVRQTLVQLSTPDEMRGRVSAVNMIFIGASNQLGEFESGLTASWWGAVPAVVIGGIGTLCVVAFFAWRFPELRKVDRYDDVKPADADETEAAVPA